MPSLTRVVSSPASYWGIQLRSLLPPKGHQGLPGRWPAGWATPRQAGTLSCCRAAGLAGGHRPGAHSALPGKTALITTPGRPRGPRRWEEKGHAEPAESRAGPAVLPAGRLQFFRSAALYFFSSHLYTLRAWVRGSHATRSSFGGGRIPQNFFVCENLKIDSRPYWTPSRPHSPKSTGF